MTYVLKLPLLEPLPQKMVDVVSLSQADTHNTCRDRLLIISNAAIFSKLVGNLAITEALFAHPHHELIV
jgi:hypothetical protein